MKSFVPCMYLVLSFAQTSVFASDDFHAYRLGHYQKAAAPLLAKTGNSAIADYYLGRMYLYGYGELKNNNLALRYFNRAAEKGFLPAVIIMAKYSLFKENNPELAVKWFKQAASAGDVPSQLFMAAAWLFGLGVKPHEDMAIKYYIEAAKGGNAIAQYALAEHFIDSKQSSNNKLGLIWLNKSVANDNPKAQSKLGRLYLTGKLVPKNVPLGIELLTKAAAKNETSAQLAIGDLALNQGQYQLALTWYNRAALQKDKHAYLSLGRAYLVDKSPIYDAHTGFLWVLKAAQLDVPGAKNTLSQLYQNGIGVAKNEDLAKQWAGLEGQNNQKNKLSPMEQAAFWLSNGLTHQMAKTSYQMHGIFNVWQNEAALKDNIYNQAPQMELFHRADIFKPQFALIQPNDIPISTYYYTLLSKADDDSNWSIPIYPLNKDIEALQKAKLGPKVTLYIPAPYRNANYHNPDLTSNSMERWSQYGQKQDQLTAIFNALYFKAILGDAASQFQIGQMFQYGIGVKKNNESAIIFYENAAAAQHLGAEYNLGVLYLQEPESKHYDLAIKWLTDAAFKGNSRAQYLLSHVLEQGKKDESGKILVKPDHEQAVSMLYLAAAQGYGLAEYDLANLLAKQTDKQLSLNVKQQKMAVIRELYLGAAKQGISEALIPLAFYNAEESNQAAQDHAFAVANEQAKAGNQQAALLLGLLYDRGIGVAKDHAKAIEWYQKSKENPVSKFILGTYIAEGQGISKDREKGIAQLKQSADNAFPYAYFNLASLEQQAGRDFLADLSTAYDLGNSHAGIVLADYYLSVNNDLEKIYKAQQIYQALADKGDHSAQLKLGFMLDKGLSGKRDTLAAQKWYGLSAEQGNPIAQFLLGQTYQLGEKSDPDYPVAMAWYQKAATKLTQASIAIGFIEETVFDNYLQAFKSYEQAALKGDAKGIYNLALMYLYGKGMPVDYKKAKALFTEASSKGLSEATNQLAEISAKGLGEPKNEKEALSLYQKAAHAGNTNALYQLGSFYLDGRAGVRSLDKARAFFKEASDQGHIEASNALKELETMPVDKRS